MSNKQLPSIHSSDALVIQWGLRESYVPSVVIHALFLFLLAHLAIPRVLAVGHPIGLPIHNPAPTPDYKIKLVVLPPEKQPEPKRLPRLQRTIVHHRLHIVHHRITPPRPVISPVPHPVNRLVTHKTVSHRPIPHARMNRTIIQEGVKSILARLRNVEIVKRPTAAAVEPTFHPVPLPDPWALPNPHTDIRSPGVKLPDGMRLDRATRPRITHEIPKGVPMQDLPRHIEDRHNGAGNSQNQAEAGPKMALLTRNNGMGLDTFKPTPHSAGGGHTSSAGADDPNPGSGGLPQFAGTLDKLGSAEPSAHSGGGPIGFAGPEGKPHPGMTGILTAPHSSWRVAMAQGAGGSLGTGKSGRSGRGGGGIGGPTSAPGAFSMRHGGGGGAGEGAGGGLGGGIGRGVGRGFGDGVGGGDGRGGGGGGAGVGSTFGAGFGSGGPGTLGNGLPDGVGEGGGGGRTGQFMRGGGGGLRPALDTPGETMVAYEIGCVLTNQQPAFDAAQLHDRSMTSLLRFVGESAHIKVQIPREDPDSYVNAVNGDMNRERPFTYQDIRGFPMIFMTGDRNFTLTAGERAALRRYVLEDGGTIYGEDCHDPGSYIPPKRGGFDAPFHRYMEEIFGQPLHTLPMTHPVYHIKFDIDEIPQGDMRESYPFEGIDVNGRTGVIYTVNDYGDVWSPVHHYYPARLRPPAYRIGANLYLYALTNYMAAHRAG